MVAVKKVTVVLFIALFLGFPLKASAAEENREELYKVTYLRASPGKLEELIEFLKQEDAAAKPMIMRHSQGDHWDLLLLENIGNYEEYFSNRGDETIERTFINALTVFREELFAYGPPANDVRTLYDANTFFHIEMFAALPGQHEALIKEREMENDFLVRTGRNPNLIFAGDMGSDIDTFTIGFYPSITEFAAPPLVSDEEANEAAIAAGFNARSDIGFYLRKFLAYHHDTLAVKVE